jgi:hypothetical protein
MPTPLEDHGGIDPGSDFPKTFADTFNQVILIVHPQPTGFNIHQFFTSLLLSHVQKILMCIPYPSDANINVPYLHPLFEFVPSDVQPLSVCMNILESSKQESVFLYEVLPGNSVPDELWCALRCTPQGLSTKFLVNNVYHQLFSLKHSGILPADDEQTPFPMPRSSILSEISIETSQCFTDLCQLATKYGTDKSPYNIQTHRHPYTPIYDMFLAPYKYLPQTLKLGEVGVLNGASIRMWRDYFPTASLFGFDISPNTLKHIEAIPNTSGILVDAGNVNGLKTSLTSACSDEKKFDILIEDASHCLKHQLLFLKTALEYIRPGGLLIIEDIFRAIPATRFEEILREQAEKIAKAVLVRPEHAFRFSPGWENDRILFVWVR